MGIEGLLPHMSGQGKLLFKRTTPEGKGEAGIAVAEVNQARRKNPDTYYPSSKPKEPPQKKKTPEEEETAYQTYWKNKGFQLASPEQIKTFEDQQLSEHPHQRYQREQGKHLISPDQIQTNREPSPGFHFKKSTHNPYSEAMPYCTRKGFAQALVELNEKKGRRNGIRGIGPRINEATVFNLIFWGFEVANRVRDPEHAAPNPSLATRIAEGVIKTTANIRGYFQEEQSIEPEEVGEQGEVADQKESDYPWTKVAARTLREGHNDFEMITTINTNYKFPRWLNEHQKDHLLLAAAALRCKGIINRDQSPYGQI